MNVTTRASIGTLRLRVPATDTRSAKALAMTVASNLALRAGDLASAAGQEKVRARITASSATPRSRLADLIVERITTRGER